MLKNYIIDIISSLADKPDSSQQQKQAFRFLIFTGIAMSFGGLIWGSILIFDNLTYQAMIPYSYTMITFINFIYLKYSKNFQIAQTIQGIISLFLPFYLQLSLGGFMASGAVILWAILSILVSFTFQTRKRVFLCFTVYITLVIISGFLDKYVRHLSNHISVNESIFLFTLNISLISISIFFLFLYFIKSKENLAIMLNMLANTDSLTKLPNRRYFFLQATHEFYHTKRQSDEFVIFLLDIDFFKAFNDNYGHDMGDFVLKKFADLLQKETRDIDLLCRYGGEEFIVLLPQTLLQESLKAAQRIIDACRHMKIEHNNKSLNITVSIGITQSTQHDKNIEEIIKRADNALYQAKNEGRDRLKTILDN